PSYVFKIANFWHQQRLCFDMKLLTDEMDKAGVGWKYYTEKDSILNAMQTINHVWNGKDRTKVQDPTKFVADIKAGKMHSKFWRSTMIVVVWFIEKTFHLKSLTQRDKMSNPLSGALDFRHPNFSPLVLPYRSDCPYFNNPTRE